MDGAVVSNDYSVLACRPGIDLDFLRILSNSVYFQQTDSAEAAETMLGIISRRRVVSWTQRDDIQNEMRNDLDDFLFDVMRDGKGHPLTPDSMDEIIDRILGIARARLPD